MSNAINLVSIGHSYVVALNRSILREIAKDPDFNVTIISPRLFKGSLRTINMEPEPPGSAINLRSVEAYFTSKMHIFAYNPKQIRGHLSQPYDLLHLWEEPYIYSGYQVAKIATEQNIPFCVRTAQSLVKKYVFPFNIFERKVFEWCDRWVAGGHLVHQAMSSKGWDADKGIVLSLGVNTNRFKPFSEAKKKEVREKLNLKQPVIGFLGRLSEEKGLDVIMQMMDSLKEHPWSLLLMGSGPYEARIKAWAHKLGISGRVHIQLYSHNDVPNILPVCDVLLCPSQTRSFWKEQFGRMIVEGFAAGVPIMASQSGEIPKVVGEAGIILPERNVKQWTDSLIQLLMNPQEQRRLRELGLQRAEHYSVKNIAEQYKEFYREIVKNCRGQKEE